MGQIVQAHERGDLQFQTILGKQLTVESMGQMVQALAQPSSANAIQFMRVAAVSLQPSMCKRTSVTIESMDQMVQAPGQAGAANAIFLIRVAAVSARPAFLCCTRHRKHCAFQ